MSFLFLLKPETKTLWQIKPHSERHWSWQIPRARWTHTTFPINTTSLIWPQHHKSEGKCAWIPGSSHLCYLSFSPVLCSSAFTSHYIVAGMTVSGKISSAGSEAFSPALRIKRLANVDRSRSQSSENYKSFHLFSSAVHTSFNEWSQFFCCFIPKSHLSIWAWCPLALGSCSWTSQLQCCSHLCIHCVII
jgi:hypothetical protein